jgi:hypothetical protein
MGTVETSKSGQIGVEFDSCIKGCYTTISSLGLPSLAFLRLERTFLRQARARCLKVGQSIGWFGE